MAIRSEDSQPQPPRDGRKRKAAIRGIVFLVVAVSAAVGAAVLLTRYMDARVNAARVPTAKIVIAKVDIPVATPIQAEWLGVVDWPAATRPEGAVSDPAGLVNQVAIAPISRGEPVFPAKLVVAGARSGLATLLPDGVRAVSVKVDEVIGVAGFVHPGDSVDVITTMKPRDDGPFVSRIVLQNIRVLAVGKDIAHRGKDATEAKVVTVATLAVTGEESERLALSASKGHILLALRGIGDEEFAETRGVTPPQMMNAAPEPVKPATPLVAADRQPSRARPRPREIARQEIPASQKQTIEILRGDLFEKRNFDTAERRP
jgi:pilus assembly protein CpaB